jgi:hypothetical protein
MQNDSFDVYNKQNDSFDVCVGSAIKLNNSPSSDTRSRRFCRHFRDWNIAELYY